MSTWQPQGELTVDSVGAELRALLPAITRGEIATLDLSRIASADSAALALILSARRAANGAGKTLAVTGLSAGLCELAGLYGVAELIDPTQAAGA